MTWLLKFRRLSSSDRRLLVQAVILHGVIGVGLRVLPFGLLRRLLAELAVTPREGPGAPGGPDLVAWAVGIVSRLGGLTATCLSRALTAQVLLTRNGYPADLRIGVAKGADGQFQAHAWVEYDGQVVIGGAGREDYMPLRVFGRNRP
jgi:hypothetical protein